MKSDQKSVAENLVGTTTEPLDKRGARKRWPWSKLRLALKEGLGLVENFLPAITHIAQLDASSEAVHS